MHIRHAVRMAMACAMVALFLLPVVPVQAGVDVLSIEVASGRDYVVGEAGLAVDSKYYIDRDYTVTALPTELEGAVFIMTANDDKNAGEDDFLKIEVGGPVVVWVAHDSRGEEEKGGTPAAWLSADMGWTKHADMALEVTDGGMGFFTMWSKEFDAGEVVLGGNAVAPAGGHGSNYLVVLTPGTSTPVESQGKLAATWGSLKSD